MTNPHKALIASVLSLGSSLLQANSPETSTLAELLPQLVEKSNVPSLAAAVVSSNQLLESEAFGIRKIGEPDHVTINDKYHLGSCTKTMTATLAAILVDEGLIEWKSTISDVLKDSIPELNPAYQNITLEQLLAHVGGLPGTPPRLIWLQAWKNQGALAPREQRLAFITPLLEARPDYKPGSKTVYSNQGYAVAGAMLETVADRDWESLLTEKVFRPLGMDSAGFRAPASPDKRDQPWGHQGSKPIPPTPAGDNPDAIGPAGTVHASITDWAKFAQYHLRGTPEPLLQNSDTLARLRQTLPHSGDHGIGGWLVHDIDRFGGHCLQMVGSNTMWYSLFWVLPERDLAIVVATNTGNDQAFPVMDEVAAAMIKKYTSQQD